MARCDFPAPVPFIFCFFFSLEGIPQKALLKQNHILPDDSISECNQSYDIICRNKLVNAALRRFFTRFCFACQTRMDLNLDSQGLYIPFANPMMSHACCSIGTAGLRMLCLDLYVTSSSHLIIWRLPTRAGLRQQSLFSTLVTAFYQAAAFIKA